MLIVSPIIRIQWLGLLTIKGSAALKFMKDWHLILLTEETFICLEFPDHKSLVAPLDQIAIVGIREEPPESP